ncbi:PepSY-associated TM helix domain-containing protein [Undibacterium terreum]|uniref:Iron-regulated membrane protein n=1 Tax=Undibacterium terreum TaxID=1224302 RepID=A0A916XLS3_9BURK|nr:PepSY-associated TM helix domain-containing protein [Undibacterium terreum]GGC80997.1 hypothetical protein GCM10011396_30240 [Undibacterium terreum]
MLKRFWFQIHWLLGISAGLILALVGATGGLYAFEEEILRLLNPEVTQVHAGPGPRLEPAELLAALKHNRPYVSSLNLSGSATDAARIGFMLPIASSDKKKFELQYVNPYTAELLGKPAGEDFFRFVLKLHRNLVLDEAGQAITGASALVLIFMCLSGLYLRWPKGKAWNRHTWRRWLILDLRRQGRSLLAELHAVCATWLLLMYLLAALTGLYWSYGWYHDWINSLAMPSAQTKQVERGAAGKKRDAPASDAADNRETDLHAVWQAFQSEVASYNKLIMLLPSRPGQAVQVLYVDDHSPHRYANNKLMLDAHSGAILKREPYADKAAGSKFLASIYALHSGSYWGSAGMLLMMLASLALPLFAVTGWMMYLARRKNRAAGTQPV